MRILERFIKSFVEQSRRILGDNLEGIYLHGSAAMGCFNEKKSDIDLLIVVDTAVSPDIKRQYMDMVMGMNCFAPDKGVEFSIVKKDVCKPFIYPTPFELHFSMEHLEWYKTDPCDYISRMNGVDRDLAAHCTVIYHRGTCVYGKAIPDIFAPVDAKFYWDSIWNDIENAEEEIRFKPTYMILNLCRVLAYRQDLLILSKKEGGNWGLSNVPSRFHGLILQALEEYRSGTSLPWDEPVMQEYAAYMLGQIQHS